MIGYEAANPASVKMRRVDQGGHVFDAAIGAWANNIQGIRFTFEDATSVRDEARANAMTDAQSKAQALANLARVRLGRPRSISESLLEPASFEAMERAYAAPAIGAGS